MLVAALAAGDLAGTERDGPSRLTDSCTECAALHADLRRDRSRDRDASRRRSAAPRRDFRLTPEQAASLRRTGWRRFVPAGAAGAFTRPLGVALATFGHRRAADRDRPAASPGSARPRRRAGRRRRRGRGSERRDVVRRGQRSRPATSRRWPGRRGCRRGRRGTGARRLRRPPRPPRGVAAPADRPAAAPASTAGRRRPPRRRSDGDRRGAEHRADRRRRASTTPAADGVLGPRRRRS